MSGAKISSSQSLLALILLLVLLISSRASRASDNDEWIKTCRTFSKIAYKIMNARQAEAPMSDVMEVAHGKNAKGVPKSIIDMTDKWVIEAYQSPAYITDHMKLMAADDFSNQKYLECVKSVRGVGG